MRSAGFTLIELLIVITIVSLLTVVGIVNFKTFSEDQIIIRASGQIQSLLRLANRNASTSVKCTDTEPAASWLLKFKTDQKTLTLVCKSPDSETEIKSLVLENGIEIDEITTSPSCSSADFPGFAVTLTYGAPLGQTDFVFARGVHNIECHPDSSTIRVKLKNTRTEATKDIVISKGGEINVQ